MAADTLAEIRSEAKARGLHWVEVRAAYQEIKSQEWEARQHPNAVRETAWCLATSRGCWPFWRHGFFARWGVKVDQTDYTAIPGYDLIAQAVATQFPEYTNRAEELFDFLLSPYNRMPDRDTLYQRAMDLVEKSRGTNQQSEWEML